MDQKYSRYDSTRKVIRHFPS